MSRILTVLESTYRSVITAFRHKRTVTIACRSGRLMNVSERREAVLLRVKKYYHGKILKDITSRINVGNAHDRVNEITINRILHKN